MKLKCAISAITLVLCLAGGVAAGQVQDGLTAPWSAADPGYAPAQFNLGVMYEKGQGVPQDNATAVSWYRKAADQGNSSAQAHLLNMSNSGQPAALAAFLLFLLTAVGIFFLTRVGPLADDEATGSPRREGEKSSITAGAASAGATRK
jgi:TPR repeat protein